MIKKIVASTCLFCTILTGCATTTDIKSNDRSKALVLLSENASGLLMIAALPLDYYCQYKMWPVPTELDVHESLLLNFIRLGYEKNTSAGFDAFFQLKSFVPGDVFISAWRMHIPEPLLQNTSQSVLLSISEADLDIHLTHSMTINCKQASQYFKKTNTTTYGLANVDTSDFSTTSAP
jgi:hypothetical protein